MLFELVSVMYDKKHKKLLKIHKKVKVKQGRLYYARNQFLNGNPVIGLYNKSEQEIYLKP